MTEQREAPATTGLRILLAHDLSTHADRAATLVAETAWPAGTIVRVVTSPAGLGPPLSSFADLHEIRAHSAEVRRLITDAHEALVDTLQGAGLAVETAIVHGKPEHRVVAEARRFEADLVVVGSRGQGSIAAAFLGSVSRAVADDAPCSVLIARSSTVQRVVLATDGEASARYATGMVASWPAFGESSILVVSVAEQPPRYPRAVLSADAWRAAFRDSINASTDLAGDVVEEAAGELTGREVEVEIRVGDAATEIVAAANAWQADLVVLGSNRRSLLARLFSENVPRAVLDGLDVSVLVARSPAGAPEADDSAGA